MATNRYLAAVLGAAITAGATGSAVYQAATQHDARVAMGAAHDVTTRHGEISVRVDAGGADVTALAAVTPGTPAQVLTVSDSGVPVWRDPAAGSSQPTTLAAQARAEATRRRGALAMRSTGSSGTATSGSTADTTPTVMLSTSGVVVVYSTQAGGYSSTVIAQSGVWATRGWYLTAQGSAVRLNLMQGSLQTVDLASVVGATGWHAVAWSIPADGLAVRYSVDGGAVTTATPSSTPLTPVARSSSDTVYVATNGAGTGTAAGVGYLALWESILADADLVALSTSPSSGAPDLSAIAGGSPAWEWAAAAFAGTQAVTIDGVLHAITGSPQVWMP